MNSKPEPEWLVDLRKELPLAPMKNTYYLSRDELNYLLGRIPDETDAIVDRETARLETILNLLGESDAAIEIASRNLETVIRKHPDGSFSMSHGPFDEVSENPKTTFANLLCITWQDDEYRWLDVLWERP